MSEPPSWLPPLVRLSDYDNDWERYLEALYEFFEADFIQSKPRFLGQTTRLKRHPRSQGKEATFWHMTSEGRDEATRQPDLARCERIRWPRAVIEHADDVAVKRWETMRGSERRICLWLQAQEYLVVLTVRRGFLLPWTAYTVTKNHRKRKLQREFEEWREQQG